MGCGVYNIKECKLKYDNRLITLLAFGLIYRLGGMPYFKQYSPFTQKRKEKHFTWDYLQKYSVTIPKKKSRE